MALTGGTLSTKIIELVGDLNIPETVKNINRSINEIERDLRQRGSKIKLDVELFGRVKDIEKDISALQRKINASSSIKNIKLGVELKDTTIKDINEQIRAVQKKVDGGSANQLKLEIDFDFKGSASKIKEELKDIQNFVQKYGKDMKNVDIINMDDDAQNVAKNADKIVNSIGGLDRGTTKVGQSIEGQMRKMTDSSGKFAVSFKQDVDGAINGATASITDADGTIRKFNYALDENTNKLQLQSRTTKESGDQQERLAQSLKGVEDAQRKLNEAISKSPQGLNRELIEQAEGHLKVARSMEEQGRVTNEGTEALKQLNNTIGVINNNTKNMKIAEEFKKVGDATRLAVSEFEKLGGSQDDINRFKNSIENMSDNSVDEMKKLQREVQDATSEIINSSNRLDGALSNISKQEFTKAVDERDIQSIKRYVEEMYGAQVETIRLTETNDKLGRSVDRLKINMQEQNGAMKSYTVDMDKGFGNAGRAIRQVDESTKTLNTNTKGLSNTFGDIVTRVTQYVGVIEVLQAGMRAVQNTIREILEINAQMTELARVADPSLNLDVMLGKSISLSKELGANVEDVLGSVAEMARTYGDFNEEQLIAIARTATMMDNVSDLNLAQSTETLVGAMNAFNISAEDSISIVDSLNEVDNQYAISTQQLAEGISRAGATAETFGVTMQQLTGDITAIGGVTMEAGSKIGNSLRTIYSRVTTMPDATKLLEEFGIAIYKMGDSGPEVRDVSNILGDLGEKWRTLSAEQQQSIGLAIAGRSRLTQFLALMNNYETAVNATTTAYNSQGSAMREQRAYMESYEYQMKVMGATATELALTMEDKLVGDAMYLVISTGTELLEVLNKVFDTFGVLPTLMGGATAGFMLLNGNIGKAITLFKTFSTTSMTLPALLGQIGTGAGGVLKSFLSWKTAGIVAIVAGVGWALEKMISTWADNKKAMEDAEVAMADAITAYNNHGQDIDSLITRYDKLNKAYEQNADSLSDDEMREYLDIINQISTILPSSVSHIDAQGQAHLKNTDMIRNEVGAIDELVKAHARLVAENTEGILEEQSESFKTAISNIEKYGESVVKTTDTIKTNSEVNKTALEWQESGSIVLEGLAKAQLWLNEVTGQATKEQENLFEAQNGLLTAQYAMKDTIQQTTSVLGDQAIAMLQSNGEMENMSTVAEALIRNHSSNNSAMLENVETLEEWEEQTAILSDKNLEFGQIVSDVYDGLAKGMADISPEKAIEGMDALVASLPTEFFTQSTEKMKSDLEALGTVISDVMSGKDLDVNGLVDSLVSAGVESDIAKGIIKDLGVTFENQSIQTAIAQDELAEYNEELVKTRDTAIEAINPLEKLFGIQNDEMQAMDSHIQTLQILRQQYGDTWTEMGVGQESISALAQAFGQSEEFVVQNLDSMALAIRALNTSTVEWSDDSQQYVRKYDESVSDSTKKFLENMLAQGNGFDGFVQEFAMKSGVVMQSQEQLEEKTAQLNERFQAFYADPSENNHNLLLSEIQAQLSELDGTFVAVKDSAGNLKLAMADGSENPYLTNLNKQIEQSGLELGLTQEETGKFYELLINGPHGDDLLTLASLNNQAEDGDFAIEKLKEAYNALKNETTSDEDRQTYITVLQNQMDAFGQSLITAKDEKGNLELAFADGSSSPWLETLNSLIGETGWKLTETTDEAGNVKFALSDQSGNELFTSAQIDANKLKQEIEGTKEANQQLKNSLAEGEMNVAVSAGEAKTEIDETKGKYEELENRISGGRAEININADGATTTVEEVNRSVQSIGDKEISLAIGANSITSLNTTIEKLKYAKTEMDSTQGKLDKLNANIALSEQNLQSIMGNVSTISSARSEMSNFLDKTNEARTALGLLYDSFANAQINTSGLSTSASTIRTEAESIRTAFDSIKAKISEVNIAIAMSTTSFNVNPLVAYRLSVQTNMALAIQAFSGLATSVPMSMAIVNQAMRFNSQGLADSSLSLGNTLTRITNNFSLMSNAVMNVLNALSVRSTGTFISMSTTLSRTNITMAKGITDNMSQMMIVSIQKFSDGASQLAQLSSQLKQAMTYQASLTKRQFSDEISGLSRTSTRIFYDMANTMVTTASNLPSRIGKGIRDNISQATGSMQTLADSMVSRFKKSLGIHSPSRVFYALGGHVIDGLVNGLSEGNLQDLGQNVFDDFSSGAISTIDQIKSYMTFDPVSAGAFGSGFTRTSGFGPRKSPGGIGSTNHKGTDYGAPNGTPIRSNASGTVVASGFHNIRGNYVIIESGNGMRHLFQHNSKNFVTNGQKVGKGQVIGTVGSTGASTGPHLHYELHINGVPVDPEKFKKNGFRGFYNGGFVENKELAWHGEEGPEAIIPLIDKRRSRGLDLWAETGERLGLDERLIRLLTASQRRTSSGGGHASFAGLDGESGGGSEASATSGTLRPDYSSVMRSLGIEQQPMFSSMAEKPQLEALYRRDMNEINMNYYSQMVTKANTELTALTEQTLKYRNALSEVNEQEKRLRDATQKELNATIKRQTQIGKELSKLQNTSKHTEAQRKQYNELQQEFDKNSQSIMSMENEVRKLNISMSDRRVEIYLDYISQLTTGYEKLRAEITNTTENLQFNLDKLVLTDENNIGAQLKIQYDILRQTVKMENTLGNNRNALQSEYNKAVKKYGKDSKQALAVRAELLSVEDDYQSSVLSRIKLEQEISKQREDIASEGIDTLKNYYKQTQTMTERAIDLERKSLEKAHEHKMSLYDDEIAKIESIYDARIQEMDEEEEENAYQESINELNQQRADLMTQISRASRDTTLEGRKRLAELQTELAEVNAEISTTQEERQDELYRKALEKQKEQQIAELELKKETAETEQELALESLDKQLADAQKYSESMINNEAMWADLQERFVAGDTSPLAQMMNEMQSEMARFMSGDYSGISMGYDSLSKEDRALFSEETLLEISNMMLDASTSMERFVSTANANVQKIGNVAGQTYNAGAETTWNRATTSTKATTAPTITTPPAPKPIATKPKQDNRYYTIKKGDTLWDLAQKYYGNPYKWTTIANANKNPDPRKLQVGRKLLIPFKTGGFTGDWTGDAGRLAVLHKKELVLNEKQTSDILNVAKVVDKITSSVPKVKAQTASIQSRVGESGGETYNIENLNMKLEGFTGTKEDARRAFDVMAKELRKKGK